MLQEPVLTTKCNVKRIFQFADAFDDSRVLLFVALYDYDPYTMSPNKDMLEDELRFEEGQLLKVCKRKRFLK